MKILNALAASETQTASSIMSDLCSITHHATETYGGVDASLRPFPTSASYEGERSASRSGRFTPGREAPVYIGQKAGWASEPIRMLDKEKKQLLSPRIEPQFLDCPAHSVSQYRPNYRE